MENLLTGAMNSQSMNYAPKEILWWTRCPTMGLIPSLFPQSAFRDTIALLFEVMILIVTFVTFFCLVWFGFVWFGFRFLLFSPYKPNHKSRNLCKQQTNISGTVGFYLPSLPERYCFTNTNDLWIIPDESSHSKEWEVAGVYNRIDSIHLVWFFPNAQAFSRGLF